MGEQLSMFNPPVPSVATSDTSKAAAEAIEPTAGTLRHAVMRFLRCCGCVGATDEQMQLALQMNPSTQRPRRIELVKGGFAFDSSRRRPTTSGRAATVWVGSKQWVSK